MRKNLLITVLLLVALSGRAQFTLLKENKGLDLNLILNGKALMVARDKTLWVTDGTPGGTIQLSATIKVTDGAALLNGNYIFGGTTPETGEELFMTDGTVAGTHILKDIITGSTSSSPDEDFALLNGIVYFTATTPANGRELWKTDGTEAGTTLFKDIIEGPADSNTPNNYNLSSNGSYLLFNANTPSSGVELYKSDGTAPGTTVLKDINPGAPSSDAAFFYPYNNMILFVATTADNGKELWRTDGTTDGTTMVKDIRTGPDGSIFLGLFYPFNGQLLFNANNGTNGEELWITDGTEGNTRLVADINPGSGGSTASLFSAIKINNKLIFTASNASTKVGEVEIGTNSELWETDGTEGGTKIFKEVVAGSTGSFPFIWPAYDFSSGTFNTVLFEGNKFFFQATTPDSGFELWVSDGTPGGTHMVKEINSGSKDAITAPSFIYTKDAIYFTADDGTHGNEIWKSDGTELGTMMIADINTAADPEDSDSDMNTPFFLGDKILFSANNGDEVNDDLYRLDGSFAPLPLKFGDFTVASKNADALLQWSTLVEVNTSSFTVQRSYDGSRFTSIGTVAAAGTSSVKQTYNYRDAGIMNAGKETIYYRIVTTDKDGKTTDSKIITLKLKGGEWSVKIISNLVRTDLDLVLTGISQNVKVSIRDIAGRPVGTALSTAVNGHVILPVSTLSPGMYLMVAESNNERRVLKFVKQ